MFNLTSYIMFEDFEEFEDYDDEVWTDEEWREYYSENRTKFPNVK